MPTSNALLGLVEQIALPGTPLQPTAESPLDFPMPAGADTLLTRVMLTTSDAQRTAFLDPNDESYPIWRPMLETLQESGTPAFLRVSDAGFVTEARMPVVARVLGIERVEESDFEVRLDISPTRDVVRTDTVEGRAMLELLRESKENADDLIITADRDARRIIDVSRTTPGVLAPRGVPFTVTDASQLPSEVDSVKRIDLKDFYAELRGDRCKLPAVAGDCLPVQYADDLCYVMADHICELLAKPPLGLTAAKVWLHGSLRMKTRNTPTCEYTWSYHVGAVLREQGTSKVLVLDPVVSLNGPLTLATWRNRISGNEEGPLFTPKIVFNSAGPGNFMKKITPNSTRNGLKAMRDELRGRALINASAPPFSHCPI